MILKNCGCSHTLIPHKVVAHCQGLQIVKEC